MLAELVKKRLWMLTLAILVVVLAMLACGGDAPPTQKVASTETAEGSPTVEAAATAGVMPQVATTAMPTIDTSYCTLGAVFQADVTVPDNTGVEAGQLFTKTWRVRNTGTCDWGVGYRLTHVDGNQMGGPDSVDIPEIPAGESAEISVRLTAPMEEGQHRGQWQICVNETECFGDRIYVQIRSTASIPMQTTSPTPVLEWEGVYIGMPADDVLKMHPKSETTEDPVTLGEDSEGLVVRWSYPSAYLIFALREGEGTDSLGMSKCYRVIEIQPR